MNSELLIRLSLFHDIHSKTKVITNLLWTGFVARGVFVRTPRTQANVHGCSVLSASQRGEAIDWTADQLTAGRAVKSIQHNDAAIEHSASNRQQLHYNYSE